jgi:RNA polymerase sigma-70 factor (ECF subfamily)
MTQLEISAPVETAPADVSGAGAEVLGELAANNLARLDWFVNAHKVPLMRYLHHHAGNEHTAEDLTQEVFLRAIRAARAGRFDGKASVRTWLFQIARHCLCDHFRRTRFRKSEPLGEALAHPMRTPGPLACAMTAEGERRVSRLLNQLPPAQAKVLALKVLGDLSIREIAQVTSQPLETVKSRLRYALQKVESLLLAQGETGHD